MFAIGLAAKKRYHIVCIIPYYIEHDYWHAVACLLYTSPDTIARKSSDTAYKQKSSDIMAK